jgi:hypothetical protein
MVCSSKRLVVATKWQNRIAQGFSLASALGRAKNEFALKGRPNDFGSTSVYSSRIGFKSWIGRTQCVESESYSGAPSGRIRWRYTQG